MFHISMGTLRHYEQEGILTPEYTDERTGYRYYSTRQFEVVNTIRYLRVLDEEDCYEGQTEELPETRCVTIRFCGSHREAGVYYKKLLDYIRCEMTPTSVVGEQQISISGGSQSPI